MPDPRGARLLDVGAGACVFANAAAAAGFRVTALEPNPNNAPAAAGGVRFVSRLLSPQLLDDATLHEAEFDLITSWHSLEHVPDPRAALELIRRLLKPGGHLLVSVPNSASLQARLGGNRWAYLDMPHHLSHFTPPGLRRLLAAAGFAVERSYNFSAEYEFFGFHQTLLNRVSRSHNFFYNRAKKGRIARAALRHPRWTTAVNAVGFLLLPASALGALLGVALQQPSCVEFVCTPRG